MCQPRTTTPRLILRAPLIVAACVGALVGFAEEWPNIELALGITLILWGAVFLSWGLAVLLIWLFLAAISIRWLSQSAIRVIANCYNYGVWIVLVGTFVELMLALSPTQTLHKQGCRQYLLVIGSAIEQYHTDFGCYPPPYVADDNGRPKHSWRALLLPYIYERGEYREYRFEEPWDSPHNRCVTSRMPPVYRCPAARERAETETNYLMLVGQGMISRGAKPTTREDVTDGLENTILIAEVERSGLHWAEPRDLDRDGLSLQVNDPNRTSISSGHPGGAMVLFCDGHVEFLPNTTAPKRLRALMTIASGDALTAPTDEK